MAPQPPSPRRILRSHSAQINTISFSPLDLEGRVNERLYSGDADGRIVITSTTTIRTIAAFKAHQAGVLTIEELADSVISHGRDNKIHVWQRITASPTLVEAAAPMDDVSPPKLKYSLDVNALNFCRFSLMRIDNDSTLIAVPNLVESSLVDIWSLPSRNRIHAAIGKQSEGSQWGTLGRGQDKTGLLMSLHLYAVPHPSNSTKQQLRVICAHEHGGVNLWARVNDESPISVEGVGWEIVWQHRTHVDSIMGMAVSPSAGFALTISADNLLVKYELKDDLQTGENSEEPLSERAKVYRGKRIGNSAISIREDARVCAVAGWDGKIRLHSTKSLKPLGTLVYHSTSCNALAFAFPYRALAMNEIEEDVEALTEDEKSRRGQWLVVGGKDGRISIWELMDFGRGGTD